MAEVPLDDVNAMSVATNGQRAVARRIWTSGRSPQASPVGAVSEIVVSVDPGTWDIASAGPSGQPLALIATERGFGALVSTRPRGGSDREELVAWSSDDGMTWDVEGAQNTLPISVKDIRNAHIAATDDGFVSTVQVVAPRRR